MCYSEGSRIPSFRYVLFQVEFPQDDENHSHTFTSFPILFDGWVYKPEIIYRNADTYKFGNVVSFADIFNSEHSLLSDGTLNMIIRVLPAPTSNLRPETRFLLSARRKCVSFIIFILVILNLLQKRSILESTLIVLQSSFRNTVLIIWMEPLLWLLQQMIMQMTLLIISLILELMCFAQIAMVILRCIGINNANK